MKIIIEKDNRTEELSFKGTAKKLLEQLGVNPETVLIVRDGQLITGQDVVTDAKEIKLLSVVSGG